MDELPNRTRLPQSALLLWGGILILRGPIATQVQAVSALLSVPKEGALASEGFELLTEEEAVRIATRHEQSISQAPFNLSVITNEDIRYSDVPDIPTGDLKILNVER